MAIEPWQIPILVMAAIAAPISLWEFVQYLRRRVGARPPLPPSPPEGASRTSVRLVIQAAVTATGVALFVFALGTEASTVLISSVTGATTLISAVLTMLNLLTLLDIRRDNRRNDPPGPEGNPGGQAA